MPAVGVLGSGPVGRAIARRAADVGYAVTVGARSPGSAGLAALADDPRITTGTFADAAASATLLVNATNGSGSLAALEAAGADRLRYKIVLDVSNELIPVTDGFPFPAASPGSSLGLRIQRAFPDAHVVKALNTMNHQIMVRPDLVVGDHLAFLCGDHVPAKAAVSSFLTDLGWREPQLLDLGGIDAAAATEMMMLVWMRVTMARGSGALRFNWAVLEARPE